MAFDPNDIYKKQEGSTVLPEQISTPKVLTGELQFLDGSKAEGISQDYTSNTYTTLPSSFALFEGLNRLQKNLNALDPDHNFYKDNSVVTLPLIDPNFSQSEEIPWKIKGWMVVDGQAVYEGVGNNENYLRIPTDVFTFPSYYHLNVVVNRLDSGYVRVYDHLNRLVLEVDQTGEYNVEMFIGEPDVTTLRITAEDVFSGDIVRIDSVNLHLVTDRFRDYFIAMLKAGDLVIGVDAKEAREIANAVVSEIVDPLKFTLSAIVDLINQHISDKQNPHDVTLGQADPSNTVGEHTHEEFDVLQQQIDECNKHVQITTGNPHGTTCKNLGAAEVGHRHKPEECGAAPVSHSHPEYLPQSALADIDKIVDQILSARGAGGGGGSAGMFLVSSTPYLGVMAPGAQDSQLWRPRTVLCLPYNLHMSETDYDYYSGLAQSNVLPMTGSNAGKAFSQYWGQTANFNVVPTNDNPVTLTYKFHFDRQIKGYRIYKSVDPDITGFATGWILSFDDSLVEAVNDTSWSALTPGTKTQCYQKSFDDPWTVAEVKLEVKAALLDDNKQWGIRVEFIYADVDTGSTLCMLPQTTVNYMNNTNDLVEEDVKLTLTTAPTKDTPIWTFLKREMLYNPDDQSVTIMHQIQPDLITPSYDQYQKGVPELMGRYETGNSHPLWGIVNANSENAAYPVRNAYSEKDNFYLSEASSLVEITHSFPHLTPASGITGFGFKWNKELIDNNWVPKSIRVTMEGNFINNEGNSVQGPKVVLDIPDLLIARSNTGPDCLYWEEIWDRNAQMSNVTSLKVELNYNGNRPGQTSVGLSEMRIFLRGWWASAETMDCSNSAKMPVGRLEYVDLPATSLLESALLHVAYPLGKIMGIPIEHFNYLLPGDYIVPNPFTTVDVDVSVFNDKQNAGTTLRTTGVYSIPAVEITDITPKDIHVHVNVPGRYGLKVIRQW